MSRIIIPILVGVFLLVSLLSTSVLFISAAESFKRPLVSYLKEFEEFKRKYDKTYESAAEEEYRFRLFVSRLPENNKQVRKLQKENPFATFGITPFSDWSEVELDRRRNKKLGQKKKKLLSSASSDSSLIKVFTESELFDGNSDGPVKVNWVAKGAVGPVMSQGQCGSCWSFSSAGCIYGQNAIKNGRHVQLSEQQLVSCDTNDYGCDGNEEYSDTVDWVVKKNNGTLDTYRSYPYVSGDGKVPKCENHTKHEIGIRRIVGGMKLPTDERKIAQILAVKGPIQISIDSSPLDKYEGGIITQHGDDKCKVDNVDHEVLIVGVDEEHSPPYWLIKNSWSKTWGESGYFRLEFGENLLCVGTYPFIWEIDRD